MITMREPKENHSYILRASGKDGISKNGFKYPNLGLVECPDWKATESCGNGLHGWLWGVGDYSLSDHKPLWQVIEVADSDIVQLGNKVKFPKGDVLYSGSLGGAYAWMKYAPHWEKAESSATGCYGHASATGKYGHASATGCYGHASATGCYGHASATGCYGHASATGKYGIGAAIGFNGTASAVEGGAIFLTYGAWVKAEFALIHVFASKVGENGIKSGKTYKLGEDGKPVEVAA